MSEGADLTLKADDGYELAATLHGADANGPLTIIAPATGAPQRFYTRFAMHVAATGRPTLTFDYRGQGRSAPADLRGSPIRFRDWGILDMPGVIAWAAQTYPGRPLHWVGHSYGGFGLGLAHNNAAVDRLFAFASMSADVRFMPPASRLTTWPKFYIGTLIARLRGFMPAGLVGTEPLPRDVMLEWYRFCTTPEFLFGLPEGALPERRHFASIRCPVRLSYATDDGWISRTGIEHLLARMTSHPDRSVWSITPDGRPIGHMGFFRSAFAATHWREATAWLNA